MGVRTVEEPWTTVAIDIIGPQTRSKNGAVYALILQDLFTKWVEIVPLRKATGKTVKKAYQDTILYRYGALKVLITDNGTEFVNKILVQVAEEYKILHTTVPPCQAEANPVERANRTLKQIIIAYLYHPGLSC